MELRTTHLEVAYDKVSATFQILDGIVNQDFLNTDILIEDQITALNDFMDTLSAITKDYLQQLDIEDLYVEGAGWFTTSYAPYTAVYNVKTMLLVVGNLLSLLPENIGSVEVKTYKIELYAKLELIEEVIEDYAKKIFSERLSKRMSDKGLTQQALADYLQIKQASVQQWCSGNGYPKVNTLIMLANTLECSVDALIRPDCIEQDFTKDILYKGIGLHSDAIDLLKGLIRDKKTDVINTINLLLSNKELVDCLVEYMNLPCETGQCVVTFKELLDLQTEIQMAENKEDAISYAKGFLQNYIDLDVQGFRKYQLDKIMLIELVEILTRMRDKRIKEVY